MSQEGNKVNSECLSGELLSSLDVEYDYWMIMVKYYQKFSNLPNSCTPVLHFHVIIPSLGCKYEAV